jgi:hypothetical protein
MTYPPSAKLKSALRWAPGPTWPCKALASITLVKGDLRAIAKAIRLSRATMRNIRQNLLFAFVYNALGIPVAAGVLYPVFGSAAQSAHCRRRDEPELSFRH